MFSAVATLDPPNTTKGNADRHRTQMALRSRALAASAAEIGAPPERNEELWNRFRFNLFGYLTECFPATTGRKPFSDKHHQVIRKLQQAVLDGGKELIVWFRGAAKSTIIENTATWAGGYGHRVFFVPIGADHEAAKQTLDSIQSEFETNDYLMQLFPAACHCARALEGVPQRAGKQTVNGELTHIEWTSERCVLPSLPGFEGSGAIIWPKGITANIRGLRFKRPDGSQARPDFVAGDDLQTDDSAASPAQVYKRMSKIKKTILRLGGHDKDMACAVIGTIIEPDDVIHQLSNPKLNPSWRVSKIPMLMSFPKALESHWIGKYAEIRTSFSGEDEDDRSRAAREATAYYAANREVMDEGGAASWEHCYIEGEELSAIQHAMNIIIDGGMDAFMSECQTEPVREANSDLVILTPDEICNKQSSYPRDQFPGECTTLTAFIDCHPSILYWETWAWEPLFTGYCINYGTFPDQRRKYFAHNHLARRLEKLFPGRDGSATIDAGIDALLHGYKPDDWPGLMKREWQRTDGAVLRLRRVLADANGEESDAIKQALRRSPFAALLTPSFGKGIGAKHKSISQWQEYRASKRRIGPEWIPTKPKLGELPGIMHDTNYWKTRFYRGLALPAGSQGALYLFHTNNPQDHRRVADHWYSEKPDKVTSGARSVFEFKQKPATDNHDLDGAVGNMVAASYEGIASVRRPIAPRRSKRRQTFYD